MAAETQDNFEGSAASRPGAEAPGAVEHGYEIRFQDHLDPYWHEWFEGWAVTNLDEGVVCLRRANVDQSALHGALNKLRDLNLKLLAVTRF